MYFRRRRPNRSDVIRILYCAASIDRSLLLRVKALLGVGLTLRVMTPVITDADQVEALAGLAIETASWSVDGQWHRGLAIRAEVQKYQPGLLLLDGVKLPPGVLLGLGTRVVGFGSQHTAIRTSWAHGFIETHPGIGVDLVSPNVTAVPPVWDPHWYPPTEDLSQFGIPGGAFTVGSVATHADYLRWLVEAGHWLPLDLPIHFLVVVPVAERQQLRRQVLGTLLPQRYHVCETVEQAPALLASCNMSVLNYDEPIQRASTLNGIHYGVPLITLLSGNTEPYVIQVQGAEQLAAQVLEIYEDRNRHATLADACRQFGEQTSAAAEVFAQAVAALNK